jgi:FkbM family methyltransferase
LIDKEEIEKYLSAFPEEKYGIYDVEGVGKFYIDNNPAWVKRRLKSGKPWEPEVLEAITRYAVPGSTALDVGAHIGSHTLTFAKSVGPKGIVFAFEPQKKIYRELVKNLELNNIKNTVPLRFAVGDHHDIIEMTRTQGRDGTMRVGIGGDKAEIRPIDSFGFSNVSIMKIDVEGHELHVLRGAAQSIQKWHPVIIIEIAGYYRYQELPAQDKKRIDRITSFFEQNGYQLSFICHAGEPHFLALHRDKHKSEV